MSWWIAVAGGLAAGAILIAWSEARGRLGLRMARRRAARYLGERAAPAHPRSAQLVPPPGPDSGPAVPHPSSPAEGEPLGWMVVGGHPFPLREVVFEGGREILIACWDGPTREASGALVITGRDSMPLGSPEDTVTVAEVPPGHTGELRFTVTWNRLTSGR